MMSLNILSDFKTDIHESVWIRDISVQLLVLKSPRHQVVFTSSVHVDSYFEGLVKLHKITFNDLVCH
ncbi:hypothetical protein CASFOL_004175 [Castilleja foliolosa]|uniref:Uncharacterized protein n=1 Tax=Castilleja foliolosa TaxID=1961234 RepID=A0ABD3EJV9_9LAMI